MSSYKQSSISDLISAWKITILFFLSSVLSEEHSLSLLPALFIPAAIDFRAPVSGSTRLCLNHMCLLTKSSRCLHCHEHHPQFKLCTTDQPEISSVLPSLQCLISCIISHTHVIMTQKCLPLRTKTPLEETQENKHDLNKSEQVSLCMC